MKTSLTLFVCLLGNHVAFSQWSTNSAVNNPVCTEFSVQNEIAMIPDGTGGAIITWLDYRLSGYTVFAQRISSTGSNQWTTNGVQISPASVNGFQPSIATDGQGGAIIAWSSGGSFGSAYAQHITSTGALEWGSNGVLICSGTTSDQWGAPRITSDGNGGAILAWNDLRNRVSFGDDDVYAQRLSSNGVPLWPANGVAVCTESDYQGSLQVTSDGQGGAVIAWQDVRSGTSIDIYAQKVNAAGTMQWAFNGVAVVSGIGGTDRYLQLASEAGGAIVCWEDQRNGTDFNIYAQKVSSNGVPQWLLNGVAVCAAANNQEFPQLAADGSGGAIIVWQDRRPAAGGTPDIYAQRIHSSGTNAWAADGIAVCNQAGPQNAPRIAPDGSGGAVIAWSDGRTGPSPNDIYAQRIDANGTGVWTANGVGVSSATGNQRIPVIINDGGNGMIVSWQDSRNDPNREDIYAQRLNADGTLGRVTPLILSAPLRPNNSRFQFTISGVAGRTYIIQASTNLNDWTAIATNVAPSDTFNFTTFNATGAKEFYRVKQGP